MNRVLLVGEAPSRDHPEWAVLRGPSGSRLSSLLGRDWREVADAINLMDWHQSVDSNGEAKFPMPEARASARMLLRSCQRLNGTSDPYRLVLLLGRRVAEAFDVGGLEYFERSSVTARTEAGMVLSHVVVVPHPSGRSRWWNSRFNRLTATAWFEWLNRHLTE